MITSAAVIATEATREALQRPTYRIHVPQPRAQT